jgi:hypothetical protein
VSINKKIVIFAVTCGDADPDPLRPFKLTTGIKEVWFTTSNAAANPLGASLHAVVKSDGLISIIDAALFWDEPVGDPCVVPGTGTPFINSAN